MEHRIGLVAVAAILTCAMAGCAVGSEGPGDDQGTGTYTTSGEVAQTTRSIDVGESTTQRQRIFEEKTGREVDVHVAPDIHHTPNLPVPTVGPGGPVEETAQ